MDRFGNLPDEIVCHILSFLTTKHAASTSVLSKRWLNLWTLIPNLGISDSEFLHPEEGKRERDGILQSFMDFVDRVLALQGDSPIEKFSLKVKTGLDNDRVNSWIRNVLQRGVSDLDLSLDIPGGEEGTHFYNFLPEEMFESKTLVKLKLRSEYGGYWWRGGTGKILPMLKTLYIDSEWITLHDKLEVFLLAFPVLEELYMTSIGWLDWDETATSASLKKLTIYGCGCEDSNLESISFDAPSLVYFDYLDFVPADFPKVNLKNLVNAQIALMVDEDEIELIRAPNDEDDDFLRLRNAWKLMSGVRNVQKLYLSEDTLEVLSLCCESLPLFNNLKYLHIESDKERGWQAMPVVLRNCPVLETLVLQGLLHYVTDKCGDACDCISREDRGRSLASCPVKKLQIKGFRGTMREIGMIKHFLDCFPCLKEIDAKENDPAKFQDPEAFELVEEILRHYKFYPIINLNCTMMSFHGRKVNS